MRTRFYLTAFLFVAAWLLVAADRGFAQQVADQLTYEGEAGEGVLVALNGTSHIVVYNLPFSFSAGESLQRIKLWVAGFRIVDGKRYRSYDTDQTEALFRVEATRRSVETLHATITDLKAQINAMASQQDATSPEVFDKMVVIFKQLTETERQVKEAQ